MITEAIIKTLNYHSKFNYPLTFYELHRFLVINRPISSNEVKRELIELVKQKQLIEINSYYFLPKLLKFLKSLKLLNIRISRRKTSAPKLRLAARAARLIGFLPWVKLICLTGALAMENCDENDDIDLMIVTSRNRLWLTRPLVVLLTSIFFKRRRPIVHRLSSIVYHRDEICLNLWLDEDVLAMSKHRWTSTTAHELAQMKPAVNKDQTYEKMLSLNKWGAKFLANFWTGVSLPYGKETPDNKTNSLLNLMNLFFFRLQFAYMKPKITSEEVNLHAAFFHPLALKHRNTRTLKQAL